MGLVIKILASLALTSLALGVASVNYAIITSNYFSIVDLGFVSVGVAIIILMVMGICFIWQPDN